MNYKTENVYFGCLTCKTEQDGFYVTNPEVFIKEDNLYLRLKSKNNDKLKPFSSDTKEYLTVSELFPMINMMKEGKISDTVSETMINLYLLKYKFTYQNKIKNFSEYKKRK